MSFLMMMCISFVIRKRNERFFLAGRMLVDVIERGAEKGSKDLNDLPSNSGRRNHRQVLGQLASEVQELRRTLVKLYAGERLRKIFDLSSSGPPGGAMDGGVDDVSPYLAKLTAMELRLFNTGSSAVASLEDWKVFGNRRLLMGPVRPPKATSSTMPINTTTTSQQKRRAVTPGNVDGEGDRSGRRQRRFY
jgi:hypothetical protein